MAFQFEPLKTVVDSAVADKQATSEYSDCDLECGICFCSSLLGKHHAVAAASEDKPIEGYWPGGFWGHVHEGSHVVLEIL